MAFDTTLALAQLAERELGHDVTTSTQRDDIVTHLDIAHKMVLAGGGVLNVDETGQFLGDDIIFNFAKSATPKVLTLLPAVTNVTVAIDRNSNAITFSVAPDGSNSIAGWFVRVQSEDELYQVFSHTAGATTAVLDGVYVGPANVTVATSDIVKLQYTVGSSDILRLVSPLQAFNGEDDRISLVDKDELYDQFPPRSVGEAFPELCAIIKEATGTYTIQFSSYPDDYKRLELDYIPVPTELNATSNVNPIIPLEYRVILAHYAAYSLMPRNNDNRGEVQLKLAQDKFAALVAWDDIGKTSADDNFGKVTISGFDTPRRIGVRKYWS